MTWAKKASLVGALRTKCAVGLSHMNTRTVRILYAVHLLGLYEGGEMRRTRDKKRSGL